MTWWWETVRAAWRRHDERRRKLVNRVDGDRLAVWWTEPQMPGVEDTGTVIATPEDLAEIGPADPVTRTGHRHQGRHARPKDFEETS